MRRLAVTLAYATLAMELSAALAYAIIPQYFFVGMSPAEINHWLALYIVATLSAVLVILIGED